MAVSVIKEKKALDLRLGCQGFKIDVGLDYVPKVNVDFVLMIPPHETDQIAEALKRLTEYLSHHIYLVHAPNDKKRCFYCGTLANPDERKCDSCGAPY